MEIKNREISGLELSVVASGYPMSTDVDRTVYDLERADRLASNPPGTGHNCFLKGIVVQVDVTAPQYWWLQFGRYHFADIVSSESKMHCITRMDISKKVNEYVSQASIDELCNRLDLYNQHKTDENFQRVIANCPMGLELTARITTNYLQLKTIYHQRQSHKLEEWHKFCDWIEELPHSEWITNNG